MDNPSSKPKSPPPDGYQTLVNHFPNGVMVLFDANFRYQIVGPETLPFSGRIATKMVGKTIHELFPKEASRRLESELGATIEGDARSFDMDYENHIHHIETNPVQINGEPFGILVTQDVTAKRQTEQELARQNERLDQFASMISHDLRNPLSLALGSLEQYREDGNKSALKNVEMALRRIDELTEDLSTLVRTDLTTDDYERVSLADVAKDAWTMIDSQSATLSVEDATVAGDGGQLQALFENLFRNAVGHGGSEVTVRVGPLSDGFYVEDTGDGIPPSDRENVFEHGYSTGYSGSGVGLTIVLRVAHSHGWEVRLRESPEGGARFEFYERKSDDE